MCQYDRPSSVKGLPLKCQALRPSSVNDAAPQMSALGRGYAQACPQHLWITRVVDALPGLENRSGVGKSGTCPSTVSIAPGVGAPHLSMKGSCPDKGKFGS